MLRSACCLKSRYKSEYRWKSWDLYPSLERPRWPSARWNLSPHHVTSFLYQDLPHFNLLRSWQEMTQQVLTWRSSEPHISWLKGPWHRCLLFPGEETGVWYSLSTFLLPSSLTPLLYRSDSAWSSYLKPHPKVPSLIDWIVSLWLLFTNSDEEASLWISQMRSISTHSCIVMWGHYSEKKTKRPRVPHKNQRALWKAQGLRGGSEGCLPLSCEW